MTTGTQKRPIPNHRRARVAGAACRLLKPSTDRSRGGITSAGSTPCTRKFSRDCSTSQQPDRSPAMHGAPSCCPICNPRCHFCSFDPTKLLSREYCLQQIAFLSSQPFTHSSSHLIETE